MELLEFTIIPVKADSTFDITVILGIAKQRCKSFCKGENLNKSLDDLSLANCPSGSPLGGGPATVRIRKRCS